MTVSVSNSPRRFSFFSFYFSSDIEVRSPRRFWDENNTLMNRSISLPYRAIGAHQCNATHRSDHFKYLHSITPPEKPSEAAKIRGLAMFTKKTSAAPTAVARPAANTSPNANPTFPDAVILTLPRVATESSDRFHCIYCTTRSRPLSGRYTTVFLVRDMHEHSQLTMNVASFILISDLRHTPMDRSSSPLYTVGLL